MITVRKIYYIARAHFTFAAVEKLFHTRLWLMNSLSNNYHSANSKWFADWRHGNLSSAWTNYSSLVQVFFICVDVTSLKISWRDTFIEYLYKVLFIKNMAAFFPVIFPAELMINMFVELYHTMQDVSWYCTRQNIGLQLTYQMVEQIHEPKPRPLPRFRNPQR
jgi:hypothetical protein